MNLFSLDGQEALVTGATRGIGQAMAYALAEAGADLILVQRDETNTETAEHIRREYKRKATIFTADLSVPAETKALVPRVLAAGHSIRILLNCAGIQRRHPSHEFPDGDWDEVLQVNLTTVFTLCRDVGAHMLSLPPLSSPTTKPTTTTTTTTSPSPSSPSSSPGRRGSIINIASLLSFQGGLTVPAYAASKGGVAQLTKALSNEWAAQGITVNAIAPGYVATEMNAALLRDEKRAQSILARIPAGRWGAPEDFKGPVVFLASPAAGYVSGEVLTVDGGWMGR